MEKSSTEISDKQPFSLAPLFFLLLDVTFLWLLFFLFFLSLHNHPNLVLGGCPRVAVQLLRSVLASEYITNQFPTFLPHSMSKYPSFPLTDEWRVSTWGCVYSQLWIRPFAGEYPGLYFFPPFLFLFLFFLNHMIFLFPCIWSLHGKWGVSVGSLVTYYHYGSAHFPVHTPLLFANLLVLYWIKTELLKLKWSNVQWTLGWQ